MTSVCKERGGDWYVKWIQSLAFCRWKQYRFKEALGLFLQQQEIVGASAALCENIGHTYSSLGDLQQVPRAPFSDVVAAMCGLAVALRFV